MTNVGNEPERSYAWRRVRTIPQLKGTKTHENLKEAFAGESQVRVLIDHDNYRTSTDLSEALRQGLPHNLGA